jgi:glycosyltransferase involved in cell wall biosynthesis
VALGPGLELHDGVHGALIANPPAGVMYVQPDWDYECWFPRDRAGFPPNPFDDLSACETVHFALPPGGAAIHASRVPVANDAPWLCESDCLTATLQYGMLYALGSEATVVAGAVPPERVLLRVRTILGRFLDERCEAVLFRTEYARSSAFEWIEQGSLVAPRELERLWAKSAVVYPAVPPSPRRAAGLLPTVLFAGRTFEDKGAEIALAVFAELRRRFEDRIRLIFVGDPPAGYELPKGIVAQPTMPRPQFLRLLRECEVLVYPTLYESLGMTLLEAAAAGLAIVTSCGPGMEHVDELLVDGRDALLVSNSLPEGRRVASYLEAVSGLLEDPRRLAAFGTEARRLATTGQFSLRERDRRLLPHYERMEARLAGAPAPTRRARPPGHGLVCRTFSQTYLVLEMAIRSGGRSRRLLLQPVAVG